MATVLPVGPSSPKWRVRYRAWVRFHKVMHHKHPYRQAWRDAKQPMKSPEKQRRSRRWWFIRSWLGAAFLAWAGWTDAFQFGATLDKVTLIFAGLGVGIIMVEMERGRRGL